MHGDLAIRMTADLFWMGLVVCLPVLGITLLVGLVVSVVQVVTQIQEMSLSFVPKLVAAAVAVIAFGPWMLRTLCRFTLSLWSQIPSLV